MRRLRQSDLLALLGVVHEIGAADDVESLRIRTARGLRDLIASDAGVFVEIDWKRQRAAVASDPSDRSDSPETERVFWKYHHQNPVSVGRARGELGALKISDFASRRQFHRLELYEYYYRPVDIEYEMAAIVLLAPGTTIGFCCNRSSRDFTERDRLVMNLLRPHLVDSYRQLGQRVALDANARLHEAGLTRREAEILDSVAYGKGNREIARDLFISTRTVEKHLEHIMRKLDVRTRTEAIAKAFAINGTEP